MRNFMENAREEVLRLENALKKIDAFLSHAPEGCLKWQNKNGKTYYYQKELNRFLRKCPSDELEEVYDNLSVERKKLVLPVQISMREKEKQWREETYEKNMMYPENLRYETEQGDVVRSKSEVIIANILYQNRKDILYKYERPLEVMENGRMKTIYPDFTILNRHTGKVTYWEHAGRMDDPHYANELVKKWGFLSWK